MIMATSQNGFLKALKGRPIFFVGWQPQAQLGDGANGHCFF